jgi:hypothetical protein
MKFLCVGYYDQEKMDALTKAQVDAVMSVCPAFMEEFHGSGQVLLVAGTESEAKVMRRVGGEVRATDSARAGRTETIGCVFLVEAADLEDAMRVASLHPTTRIGEGEHLGFRLGISPVHGFEVGELRK